MSKSHMSSCVSLSEWPHSGHIVSADRNDKSESVILIDGISYVARSAKFFLLFSQVSVTNQTEITGCRLL